MARGRTYKVGVFDTSTWLATGATVTTTAALPILYWTGLATTNYMNIFNISVGVLGPSGTTIPSNASVAWSINVVTGTLGGGQPATKTQLSGVAVASALTFTTGGGTSAAPISGQAVGASAWDRVTPFAAGANWEDIVTYGDEIGLGGAATNYAVCVSLSQASTATTFFAEIEWSE
jgi:hypothetical protein